MHLDVAAVSANRRDELPQTHCPPICHVTHRHKPQNQRKSEKGSSGRLSSSSSTGTRSKTVTSRKRRAGGSMTAGRHYVMQSGLSPRRADAGVSAGYQNWIPLSVCSLPPELRSHWLLQQLSSLLQGHTGQENQHFKNSASYKLSHMIISTGCWTPSPPQPAPPSPRAPVLLTGWNVSIGFGIRPKVFWFGAVCLKPGACVNIGMCERRLANKTGLMVNARGHRGCVWCLSASTRTETLPHTRSGLPSMPRRLVTGRM